ncbi:MAG: YceI family protein [Calditrichaeota bacterium]|nr:YceI family protein [Calditrichota bacterium]
MNKKINFRSVIILFILFLLSGLHAEKWVVDTTRSNQVIFYANATLGSFEGKTNHIRGYLMWEGNDTLSTGKAYFEVDLSTLDTGIGLRNSHMRNKYLETEKYPRAIFEGDMIDWKTVSAGKHEISATGILKIHGEIKEISLISTLQQVPEGYRSITNFELNITDFGIEKPGFLLTSMDEQVRLRILLYMTGEETMKQETE